MRRNAGEPLARSEGLLVEEVGEETVVYDRETGEAHCLSPIAAAVYAECDGSNSVKELAKLAGSRLGEPIEIERVDAALAQLEERELLAALPKGVSRRAFVRRTAVATAALAATPMITSIVTPAYAQVVASPGPRCPRELCASQSDGDPFCDTLGVPQEDSCECEDCSVLMTLGIPCPTPVPCSSVPPGTGGCNDNSKFLDGLCILILGDT